MNAKTPAEIEREKINVTNNEKTEKTAEELAAEEAAKKAAEDEENNEDNENEDNENEEDELTDEQKKEIEDKKKEKELTPEQKAKAETEEKERRKQERIDRRIAKLTGEKKELEKLKIDLEAKLAAKAEEDGVKLTEEDVKKEAKRIADEQIAARDFTNACNRIAEAAQKESGLKQREFDKKVTDMAEEIGPIPSQMIGILDDLENGGAVLNYLINNLDDAEDIWALSPARMAVRLAKLSTKIDDEKKPKPRQISKTPDPNEAISGGSKSPTILSDKEPMDEWIRKRNQQVEDRRKQKLSGMR